MDDYSEQRLQEMVRHFGDWFLDEQNCRKGQMTQNLYPYTQMFSPIRVNRLKIKNRLVMAPMGNISMAEETGRPNERMVAYFTERAKGGVGLITSGLIPISFGIDHSLIELGDLSYFPRIDRSRTVFATWRDIAANCHAWGASFFIQLTPGLGRVGNPQCLVSQHKFPVSASWNPNYYMPALPCLPLSTHHLKKIIKNGGQAAADAKAANIDGVYLHGHEGYLLEQLTNPAFNRRSVGRYADWQAFGLDLVREIRRRCGDRYPIMYRIDLSLALNETYGSRMNTEKSLKKFRHERKIAETLDYMRNLVQAGVDLFDVDLGCYDNWWLPHPPMSMPAGCYLEVAGLVKSYFADEKILSNAGIPVPIVAVGKLGYPDLAETALREGRCDMVMLGRPLLADPQWPQKAFAGQVDRIRPCIGCQEACINEFVDGGHPQCAVNPRTAFELELPAEIPPAAKQRKVAVIGGGPAGVECALAALARGHEVFLYEREAELGGIVRLGSIPLIKYDIANYLLWLQNRARRAEANPRFHCLLNTEATVAGLSGRYDVIVAATGTRQQLPPVPGAELAVFGTSLLADPALMAGKERIIVVGGGAVGCEIAYWLAYEHKKNVQVVEMLPYFMNHVCTANRGHLIHYLEKAGVGLLNGTRLLAVERGQVRLSRNVSPSMPNPYNTWQPILPENIENPLAKTIREDLREVTLPADLVVIATGGKSDETLYEACVQALAAPELHKVGDANTPAKVMEAVKAGYRLGCSL